MAKRKTITGVRDILDGQPAIVLANGHLATFDNVRKTYVDTGIKAVADDDPSAVKYFKLSNESVVPSAPSRQSGWATLNDLNAALSAAGWSENPVSTSADNRYCFMAVYGKSNVHDAAASAAKGTNVFKEKFTLSAVVLWSNYANSPVISVEGDRLVITNPDGSRVEQQFATSESTDALLKLIQGLQKQVDKAVYSYNGEGAPSMSGSPTTSWLFDSEGQPITNPGMIADIYSTHVGDTYTDIKTFVSYSFILKPGASSSEPGSYVWEEIKNSALTKALAEISKLGREKLTIHTEKPVTGYKKGDIWLKDENTRLWAIRDNTSFSEADWVNPYVSRKDYERFKEEYAELLTHFRTAQGNITDILNAMKGLDSSVSEAFRDTIITEAERRDLSELSKKLDIEQAQLQSNVNYILDNEFLPADLKSELTTKSKKLLAASTGSIDKLQESIATAIADNKITEQERADYNEKYQAYVTDVKSLTECVDKCRQAIDKKIKQSAIDGVQVGGRNLLTLEHLKRVKLYIGESDDPRYYFQGSWSYMYNKNVLPGGTTYFHFLVTNNEIAFQNGSYYTFSCEYLSDETSSGSYIASIFFYYGDGTKEPIGHILSNPAGGGKKAGKIVGTSNPLRVLKGVGGAYGTSGKALMNIQLEKGNKPTSIQPAPEDFEARVADAKSEADKANALLSDIANDSKLTPTEKREASREWEEIKIERSKNIELANKYKASKTAYENAYNALNSYITPLLADTSATSEISKTEFTNKFKAYYEAREALLVEVQEKVKQAAADDILLGERNLLLKSNIPVSNSNYLLKEYDISEAGRNLEDGETVTVVIAGNVGEGKNYFILYNSGAAVLINYIFKRNFNNNGIACVSFEWKKNLKQYTSNNTKLRVYASPDSGTGESSIDWIKLVRGNKTSLEWTEAPEDAEARLNAVKAIKMPEIDPVTKNWKLWDDEQKTLVDSGLSSKGDNGNSPYISERTKTWWEYDAENPTAQVEGEKRGYKDTGIKADGVAVRPNLTKEPVNITGEYPYRTVELLSDNFLGRRVFLVRGKSNTSPVYFGEYVTTEDNELLFFSVYYKNENMEETTRRSYVILYDSKKVKAYGKTALEKSSEWQRVISKAIIPEKGTLLRFYVYYPHNNDGIASDATTIYYAAPKIERILPGEPEIPTAYIPHVEDLKGETGKDGMPALSESISVQGEFKTRYKVVDDAGKPYSEPVPVRYIEGGVRVGSKDYVQAKVVISLGATDVTAKALANGANLIWRVNGQQVASNVDTVNLGIEYADGVSDKIEVEYEDGNAEKWL
ncbi:MAG: DUF1542 domain-containing protein [Bacteroides pyogenes]|uniref:hypothetical protein n=1 Tax=Bacteroides pyogenes TaxID=310300 RepID=UPI00242CDD4A|nr:hypothetical protein [Bacteroides pyogenes]MCI7071276.1 DUF1542 domain-containing protein [Bacteroides pyogenes]